MPMTAPPMPPAQFPMNPGHPTKSSSRPIHPSPLKVSEHLYKHEARKPIDCDRIYEEYVKYQTSLIVGCRSGKMTGSRLKEMLQRQDMHRAKREVEVNRLDRKYNTGPSSAKMTLRGAGQKMSSEQMDAHLHRMVAKPRERWAAFNRKVAIEEEKEHPPKKLAGSKYEAAMQRMAEQAGQQALKRELLRRKYLGPTAPTKRLTVQEQNEIATRLKAGEKPEVSAAIFAAPRPPTAGPMPSSGPARPSRCNLRSAGPRLQEP
mmetsp:Transcript_30786/g.55358  ORF Transcript_30786/g.55358 Transcript_30786/m.55358 type:complete len:261 (-) Transcript_30786:21-803(-)